ncbi:MAG: TonB-dependent receptor [Williamsia sp.]|nr:TonB-dependent receptor [Williamsia sp.]
MNRNLAVLVCLLFSFFSYAQNSSDGPGKIRGRVIDSITSLPIEYATITLKSTGTGKVVTGNTSDSLGNFTIQGIKEGAYDLSVEFIGFKTRTLNNVTISKKQANLPVYTFLLQGAGTSLQEVTVTARAKLIDNRIDKMVFNAEADLTGQTGVATDILKKIPQVSVDPDGNVELAGTGGIRFLINGKPSAVFGNNVADVLQSIPASQIKSIEVITNPGARYDAQGMGGIINIILKQTKVKGISGNMALTAGTRAENGSLNLALRQNNFGLNAFVSGNSRLAVNTPSTSDRKSVDTSSQQSVAFRQNGVNRFHRYGVESGIGFDWTVKKHNNFSGNVNYDHFGNGGSGVINQQQQVFANHTGNIISDLLTINHLNNRSASHAVDASLNYKRTFEREDQELEISANTSVDNRNARADNFQALLPQDSIYYGINNHNRGKEGETQLSVDYSQPLAKNVMLGVGGRITFNDIHSNADVFALQPITKGYLFDSSVSNYLDYHQKVYAGYAELTLPVSNWFDIKAGTRYERTQINSFYSNAQQQVKNPGYNTWVPSVYVSRKLSDDQSIKLSYSKRIERPDYGDLNPFVNTTDPKNITAGNPYLLPELGMRYELTYNHDFGSFGSLMATLFYRINKNDIQPYVAFYPSLQVGDSTYTNVSVSTRENIGTEKNMGVNLFFDMHPTRKLGIRTNLFSFRRHIINGIDLGHNPTSFNYRANINMTYEFSKTLITEFFGNFNSARNELQGKYPSFTTYSLAVRKQFWNKNGSLALVATNFFKEYVNQPTILYGTNFTTNSQRKIPFRSIGLNFTWKFGKLEFKKRDDNQPDSFLPEGQG